jgi:hypothetical protein
MTPESEISARGAKQDNNQSISRIESARGEDENQYAEDLLISDIQ